MTQEHHLGNSSGSYEIFVLVALFKDDQQTLCAFPSHAKADNYCRGLCMYHFGRPNYTTHMPAKWDEETRVWFDQHPARAYHVDVINCLGFEVRAVPYYKEQK